MNDEKGMTIEEAQLKASVEAIKQIAELRGLLIEARKIIRASSSRQLAKDWDQRATKALK